VQRYSWVLTDNAVQFTFPPLSCNKFSFLQILYSPQNGRTSLKLYQIAACILQVACSGALANNEMLQPSWANAEELVTAEEVGHGGRTRQCTEMPIFTY
jgi:hypothetical protein